MPDSFVLTPDGFLLAANGIDPWLRWDGLTGQAEPAGVLAPATALTLSGFGAGQIVGTYAAYVRFVDQYGNFSDLSPLSNIYTPQSSTGIITNVTSDTPMVVTAPGHGLTTNTVVKITGAGGIPSINNTWIITVLDPDTFSLNGSGGGGSYTGGGVWVAGVDTILYENLPVPIEPKVVRRQILRNLDGEDSVFYVDVDTTDLASASLFSTLTDPFLATGTPVTLLSSTGQPLANANGIPPNWKSVIVSHLGRMYANTDVPYAEGCVSVTLGSVKVQGVGTEWKSSMAISRFLYIDGADQPYEIDSIDETAQVVTLTTPYNSSTSPYATYAIQPSPSEERLLYYTEAGLYQSWPAENALALPQDNDLQTGLIANGSFLYILERRHLYRFTVQTDPATDGYLFQASNARGCLNQRCWVIVGDTIYLMDEQGIYGFSGGQPGPSLSEPIQDIFRKNDGMYSINWAASKCFHAVHFPTQETIRWFVCLAGHYLPRHALVFNYVLQRWWIEEFAVPIGSSMTAAYLGERMVFLGTTAARVLAYWTGTLDGPSASGGTVRGTAASAGLLTLSDSTATFNAEEVIGHPVTILDGRGQDQRRIVAAATATELTFTQPWSVLPDRTSVYQVGGVGWRYRTPWFRFIQDEANNPRRLELIWDPTPTPGLMRLRVTDDTATTPSVWQTSYTSPDHNGVRVVAGSPDLTVDLTKINGFVQQRLDHKREYNVDAARFIYVEMIGCNQPDPLVIAQLTIDGV